MVDNITLNPGAGGDTVAADDIGGVKTPRCKMQLGADGVNDGDVSAANPLPVVSTMTWAAPTNATVGVASGAVLAANASRKGAIIVNDSNRVIYLGIGAAAVVGSGIRLNANGGSYEISALNLSTQVINGIASVAGNNVTVHEAT
jgi:hypothetical protein